MEPVVSIAKAFQCNVKTIRHAATGRMFKGTVFPDDIQLACLKRREHSLQYANKRKQIVKTRLTMEDARAIRVRIACGESMPRLAKEYKVSTTLIQHIKEHRIYKEA